MSGSDAAPSRQIILLSAGIKACREAAGEQAVELAAQVDWELLAASLHARRLLPTLGPRIVEMANGQASCDFVAYVDRAVEVARRQGAFLQLISAQLVDALAAAGVCCTPLKGCQLSETLYGDPGRRLAGDIDLLVARDQLRPAVEVVRGLGYGAPVDHVDRDGLPQLHFALSHESEELPPVELHWRVHWYERDFAADRLLPPNASSSARWRPAPIDELAALLLFYARDGFVDLRLATDIAAWWDIRGSAVRAGDFARLLRLYPPLRRPLLAAAAVAERVVGFPSAKMVAVSDLDLRGRMAIRLADPNPDPRCRRSQIHATMGLVDGLLMPSGELGEFLKRQVLLPRDVLDEHDRKLARSPRSQASHGVRTLARIGAAGARLARPSEAVR